MKHIDNARKTAVMATALICLIVVAAAGQSPDRGSGTFRGNWWNYYERGVEYLEEGTKAHDAGAAAARDKAFALAESDFKEAIKLRDEDQRRARTYGMHLIDYFAHRELGMIYQLQGRNDDAIRELEQSLATVESSKAQFYLDKARKAKIDGTGGDTRNPSLTLDALPARVKESGIELVARASDDNFIASVVVADAAELIPLSQKAVEVRREIELIEGANEIKVVARDLSGNEATATATVVCDTTGPSVTIESTAPADGGKIKVKGWVEDEAGVKELVIGGAKIEAKADGSFEAVVPAAGEIVFRALDGVGNETTGDVNQSDANPREGRLMFKKYATLLNGPNEDPFAGSFLLSKEYEVAQAAQTGPKIDIKGLTGKQTVYYNQFYIEGTVSDPAGVASLVSGSKSLIAKPGQKVYFNYLTRLRKGPNKIVFVAKNNRGVASQREIEVVLEEPEVRKVGNRMSVSMLPFHLRGQHNLSQVAYDDLIKSITTTGRFRLIDRMMIEKVVSELKLSGAGLTDPAGSVKAGKLAQSEVVLIGFVNETPRSIEVYARLVEVETSAILAEKDAYLEGRPLTLKDLIALMDGLAAKIRGQFPMAEGAIAKLDGKNMTAKLAAKVPVSAGTRVIVFREKPVLHPETKKPLGMQTIPVAEAKVVKVSGGEISAQFVSGSDLKKVSITDKIITK